MFYVGYIQRMPCCPFHGSVSVLLHPECDVGNKLIKQQLTDKQHLSASVQYFSLKAHLVPLRLKCYHFNASLLSTSK